MPGPAAALILYATDLSGYCAKIRIALAAKDLAFETREPPGGYGSAAYRAIVPLGTVPAIVHGDFVLSESEIIVEYLEETFPAPALLFGTPAERARQRFLARFHDLRLEPPLRALFGQVAPARRDAAAVAARLDEFALRLAELEAMAEPGPYLAGTLLGVADLGYPATLMLAERLHAALGRRLTLPPKLARWRATTCADPAVAPALARCTSATDSWLAQRLAA